MKDEWVTITQRAEDETKVRGSKFIAVALPVETRQQALDAVEASRKEHFDATHHCYAYRLGAGGDESRSSDDGEPSGTAGRPILAAIERSGMTGIIVVVTRYFGGTKLGVGGLARAYGGAAENVLSKTTPVTRYEMCPLEVAFPHAMVSAVMHAVTQCRAKIVDTAYDEEVHMTLAIRKSQFDGLCSLLRDRTSGNIRMK
jgi:uncharacterized YigZ family protein